jgi:hypothetical protein
MQAMGDSAACAAHGGQATRAPLATSAAVKKPRDAIAGAIPGRYEIGRAPPLSGAGPCFATADALSQVTHTAAAAA